MNEMHPYFPILLLLGLGIIFPLLFIVISSKLGKPKVSKTDLTPYECGVDTAKPFQDRFSVKFFLVALLFILFDVEAVFLYPWAVLFGDFVDRGAGLFVLAEMFLFIGILGLGLIYVWKRRALEWDNE